VTEQLAESRRERRRAPGTGISYAEEQRTGELRVV
jgi:hypothetical protein